MGRKKSGDTITVAEEVAEKRFKEAIIKDDLKPNTNEYKNAWQKNKTDRINLILPIGKKAEIQEYLEKKATETGKKETVNGFINRIIDQVLSGELVAADHAEGSRSDPAAIK